MRTVKTSQEKVPFTVKRFLKFLRAMASNRRGILGIAILVFFTTLAFIAPLLTPYDPMFSTFLAIEHAVPSWFRSLPGNAYLSENVILLQKPGFATESSLNEWVFTRTSTLVSYSFDPTRGYEGLGSILLEYRPTLEPSETKVSISKEFTFPYGGPPARFTPTIDLLILGTGQNITIAETPRTFLEINATVTVFIKQVGGKRYDIRSTYYPVTRGVWILEGPMSDSAWTDVATKFLPTPSKAIFSKAGNYIIGLEITFKKTLFANENSAITVNIDNLNLKLLGTAFGLLGTDYVGRDIFSQLVYGARISLFVGLVSAGLSVFIGLIIGLISGYTGRIADELLMRLTDMLLVLPGLPLLLVLVAVLGPSIFNLIMVIGFLGWMGFARVVRSQVLSLKERPFVEAAKAVGSGSFHIISRHILPNVVSLAYVSLALAVPGAIISEAALSWLGLYDPYVVSWGRMLHDVQMTGAISAWWWVVPPGLFIATVSLSFVLIGYALDELLNPRLRIRR